VIFWQSLLTWAERKQVATEGALACSYTPRSQGQQEGFESWRDLRLLRVGASLFPWIGVRLYFPRFTLVLISTGLSEHLS
jgi:hypothetical protein